MLSKRITCCASTAAARATGNGNFISVRYRWSRAVSSSMLISRNATFGSPWYFAYAVFRCGNSARQIPHQEAKKFSSRTFPRRLEVSYGRPSTVVSVSFGSGRSTRLLSAAALRSSRRRDSSVSSQASKDASDARRGMADSACVARWRSGGREAALGHRDRAVQLAAIDEDLRAGEVRRRIGLRLRARFDRRENVGDRRRRGAPV